jgi:P27 family predicted phage terminase small subunit
MARHKTPNNVLKSRASKHVRDDEPEASTGSVSPTFPMTKEGGEAFERLCIELDLLGVLSPTYADFITIASDAIGDIQIAIDGLKKDGYISVTERGVAKNPFVTIKNSATTTAHKYLCALGLSPTSIGKLTGVKKEEINEFEVD